jgi:uncharacterized protein (TIGR02594 family)
MHEIIDVPQDVGPFAERLATAGVKTVIRYYNHRNGSGLPTKALTRRELDALHGAGLSVAVVFQQRGGSGGNIADLSAAAGARDAARALQMAGTMAQPAGSALYFAVDHDYFRTADLAQIEGYFRAVRTAVGSRFTIGVYGSGTVGRRLKAAGLVEHIWLTGASGWSGTQQALQDGIWALNQRYLELTSPIGAFAYDGNVANGAHAGFGQFGPGAVVETGRTAPDGGLFRVVARSGLNLRSGPGEAYRIIQTLASGTLVTGRGVTGPWMKIDLDGDGNADGYMFASYLQSVSGGLPIEPAQARQPIDVARAELAMNISEFPGPANNPRIVLYHSTTSGGGAPDQTAWCSSFVNYCVEQAGYAGTDSKWARSWHDAGWGQEVTAAPAVGDVVVWRRVGNGDDGGHVGFFIGRDATGISVLGGNQSNKVCIQRYPENGTLGAFAYTLLSIRRPA